VKCLLLKNDLIVISEIVEVAGELGEPDCKLTNPFRMVKQKETDSYTLETWLDFTDQNEIMIHSDSILTLVDPTSDLLSKYFDLIK
tara:strand:- start:335 stop:592 length:258 start_codon:yes stop_codon:yes gene_type:complete